MCAFWFRIHAKLWAHTLRHPCLARPSRYTNPLHSHNHCKRTTRPRLAPPHLPPLSKVRCCRPIKFGRRPEGLPHHYSSPCTNPSKTTLSHSLFVMPTSICTIRFHIRTILFAFRRVRVCVCFLVSHPCETMGTHAKASLPCLPLPLHQSLLFSLIFVKEHLSLALLAPPETSL